jgi:type II secretory pathway pseudopilin PulG
MGWLTEALRDRRRRQSGATLIELLVSVTIMGLALTLVIGAFSTGVLDATLAKRNTAVQAVIQYEMESISSSQFNPNARAYSECFATENPGAPLLLANYQGSCPSSAYTLRSDVSWKPGPTASSQQWTVTVSSWPGGTQVGVPVDIYKVNR